MPRLEARILKQPAFARADLPGPGRGHPCGLARRGAESARSRRPVRARRARGLDARGGGQRAVAGDTKLADVAARKALLEGGAEAIAKSDDPMIALARRVEPVYARAARLARGEHPERRGERGAEDRRGALRRLRQERLPGRDFDAKAGLRSVSGYEEDTTLVPYKTTFLWPLRPRRGLRREAALRPARTGTRRQARQLDLSTPFNFVYTADTIGGNSGSPVINRAGEVVGLNFDSNIQKLPNRYWYVDEAEGGRAVGVHSAAIIEALRKLYGAQKLVDELLGR